MWTSIPRWYRRLFLGMAVSIVLPSLAGGLVFGVAPQAGQKAMSEATEAICQDGHVAYSDQRERLQTCLRHTVAKIDKSLKQHGVDSHEIDELRALTENQ